MCCGTRGCLNILFRALVGGRICKQSLDGRAGYTLLELLIAVVVLGTLTGIISFQIAPLLAQTRLAGGVRQVASDLQLVRMKAIAQNSRFRVTFRPESGEYVVEKDVLGEWQSHVLRSHEVGPRDDVTILLPTGVSITAVNSRGDIVFVPRGYVDGGITISLGFKNESRRVVVNLAGRVRIE